MELNSLVNVREKVLMMAVEYVGRQSHGEWLFVSDVADDIGEEYQFTSVEDATKALEEYGTFDAIREVLEQEDAYQIGFTTDPSKPLDVANKLWYMKVHQELSFLQDDMYMSCGLLKELSSEIVNQYIEKENL